MTTPSAPLRRLRAFFLLAQPPLLFQEGNTLSWQFIHTFIERPLQYGGKPGALALALTAPAVLQLVLREEAVVIGVQTVKHFGAALPFLA